MIRLTVIAVIGALALTPAAALACGAHAAKADATDLSAAKKKKKVMKAAKKEKVEYMRAVPAK